MCMNMPPAHKNITLFNLAEKAWEEIPRLFLGLKSGGPCDSLPRKGREGLTNCLFQPCQVEAILNEPMALQGKNLNADQRTKSNAHTKCQEPYFLSTLIDTSAHLHIRTFTHHFPSSSYPPTFPKWRSCSMPASAPKGC